MKLGRWICEIIIVVLVVGLMLGIWWFVATKDEWAMDAQYEQLLRFANRQSVELAVIKQAAELRQLRAAMQPPSPNDVQ